MDSKGTQGAFSGQTKKIDGREHGRAQTNADHELKQPTPPTTNPIASPTRIQYPLRVAIRGREWGCCDEGVTWGGHWEDMGSRGVRGVSRSG